MRIIRANIEVLYGDRPTTFELLFIPCIMYNIKRACLHRHIRMHCCKGVVMSNRIPTRRTSGSIPTVPRSVAQTQLWGWIVCVGFAWLVWLWVVFTHEWSPTNTQEQLLLVGATVLVGLLTFLPFEMVHAVDGITVRGVAGMVLAILVLVYVPEPTQSLLAMSEVPVYVLAVFAIYWLVSSLCMPVLYVIGLRLFTRRARRYDVRRSYRQAAELALAVAGMFVLFALRALTPMLMVLWVVMLVIVEVIFLSFSESPTTR